MDTKALLASIRERARDLEPLPPPRDTIWELTADHLGLNQRQTDTVNPEPLLEAMMPDGEFFVAPPEVWDCWTGLRRRNGEDYHGPVYFTGTRTIYTGRRTCSCPTCEASIQPHLRYD